MIILPAPGMGHQDIPDPEMFCERVCVFIYKTFPTGGENFNQTDSAMRIPVVIFFLSCCFLAGAQNNEQGRTKIFNAWLKTSGKQAKIKGILYEVSDSSVFLVKSLTYPEKTEYKFSDIDRIRLRNEKSVMRGLISGSAIGLGSGLIMGASVAKDMPFFGGLVASYIGITGALYGAGIGTLAGLISDPYPVKSSRDNFKKYQGNLMAYSFLEETITAPPKFSHRYYGGFWMGVSKARSDFGSKISSQDYPGMDLTGISSQMIFGYRFTPFLGVNITFGTSQYGLKNGTSDLVWDYDTFMAGPVLSVSASDKLRFEFAPSIGFASAYQYDGIDNLYEGSGIGYSLGGAIAFDMSKRWLASANVRYKSSRYNYSKDGKIGTVDSEIGVAYKFGKRSL